MLEQKEQLDVISHETKIIKKPLSVSPDEGFTLIDGVGTTEKKGKENS